MMALLSIKPFFAEKIFSGEKKVEFRKSSFKQSITTVLLYATMPVGKVVGQFEIETILCDNPAKLWIETKDIAGISLDIFNKYFYGRNIAYGIKIKHVIQYPVPFDPYLKFPNFIPPQSFRYVSNLIF